MRAIDFITEESKAVKYKNLVLKYAFNDNALVMKAFEKGNPIAYVKFVKEKQELYPQDLWVNDDYRNRGIAKSMYDYLKSERYVINRSHDQTKAGTGFWDKHRGEDAYVWEQDLEEGWKDWVAGAAIGAAALGGGNVDAKPMPTQKPAITQPAQQKSEPINMLSNNPQHEAVLHRAAKQAGIKGVELAQFMAQTKHESWDFSRLKEKGMGKGYFAKKYDPKYAPRTAKILGNKNVGDGEKYHGRGFIQLTGRDNYRMAQDALQIPLLKQPELAENPEIAAKIAIWYWQTRVKPSINNFNDTKAVTQKINPAGKGLQDRHANFVDYKNIL
jgi:predicted chitinase